MTCVPPFPSPTFIAFSQIYSSLSLKFIAFIPFIICVCVWACVYVVVCVCGVFTYTLIYDKIYK